MVYCLRGTQDGRDQGPGADHLPLLRVNDMRDEAGDAFLRGQLNNTSLLTGQEAPPPALQV